MEPTEGLSQFSLNELLKEAKQEIVKNNTSSEIVNTGLDLQIDNLANHAAPLMFGSEDILLNGQLMTIDGGAYRPPGAIVIDHY